MVKHNNVIPDQHFHKNWARRVKTTLNQPAQKRIRREKRKVRAAQLAPRPAAGALRPLVHAPTKKYNSKVRFGRGFTLEELKTAGINVNFAKTVGIAVDPRRTNKCEESLQLNADRLKDYKARLVVFPRGAKQDTVPQLRGPIVAAPAKAPAVTFVQVTDEMKAVRGYGDVRAARNDARLVGIRVKQAKSKKEEKDE